MTVHRLKRLEKAIKKIHENKRIPWNYRINIGEKPCREIFDQNEYFPQRISSGTIGHPCEAKIWLDHHHVSYRATEGRMARLFNLGHVIEKLTINELYALGYGVHGFDPKSEPGDPKQFEYSAFNNTLVARLDGILPKGIPEYKFKSILEIKSMNKNKFKEVVEDGIKKFSIMYYVQVQIGMSLSKIPTCVYICNSKDNSDVYCELIKYHKPTAVYYKKRAKRILSNHDEIPQKDTSECYFCTHKDFCAGAPALRRCRTCRYLNWNRMVCTHKDSKGFEVGYGDVCKGKHEYMEVFNSGGIL